MRLLEIKKEVLMLLAEADQLAKGIRESQSNLSLNQDLQQENAASRQVLQAR